MRRSGGGGRSPRLAAALLAVLALAACGRKGPPVAPETRAPRAVGDLQGRVRGEAIELTWTKPSRRVDNTPRPDLGIAYVYRVEDAGTGEPKPALLVDDRIAGYAPVAVIRLTEPPATFVHGDRIVYPDRRELTAGRRYTYVVLTADTAGRVSPPSARASITFLPAPTAPGDLRAAPGEQRVVLTWTAPARLLDGGPVTGPLVYEVLRAPTPDAPLAPVAQTAPGQTTATDRGLENDRTYYYAVRAIRTEGDQRAESEPSVRVAAMPVDLTPPSPPANLVAIPSEGEVRLSWSPSPEPDVAGYVVYRAAGGGPMVRVGSTRTPATNFSDRDVPRGTYRYAVTAYDRGSRANESARSVPVSVAVP